MLVMGNGKSQLSITHYPLPILCDLAAAYGYGLVKNHCFVDGNKRIAFVVMAVFLLRNGYELISTEVEAVDIIIKLAQGNISQSELAFWLTHNSVVIT